MPLSSSDDDESIQFNKDSSDKGFDKKSDKDSDKESEEMEEVDDVEESADEEDETAANVKWIDQQLQASIFYAEPVHHITYQVLHADASGILTHIETFIERLAVPNTVGRMDIARIIKRARFDPDGGLAYRLNSLFIYNVHITLPQLAAYVRTPSLFNFVTVLSSISNYTFKPTLACFHSLNSIHIVLVPKQRSSQTPTQTQTQTHTQTQTQTHTRTVRITRDAMRQSQQQQQFGRRNQSRRRAVQI